MSASIPHRRLSTVRDLSSAADRVVFRNAGQNRVVAVT